MIEHLIVSTLVLAVAMLAARTLPLTARTRHALLLCGLAKFAIPASLFELAGVQTIKVLPMTPRVLGAAGATSATTAPVNWLLVAWTAIAALVFARWLLLRTRTVAAALRSPAPPSQRELDALSDARRILGVRTAADILRSPICEAPAVLRVVRPVIVLPARGCDDLTDDELRALLLHELAHVSRRDNLVAAICALASALLWFHPLVWWAMRMINTTREQACDERVAEAMEQTGTYLDALMKVCRNIVATRTAGASCMAGANVKERMEHLMRYDSLKRTAWSHRGIVAAMIIVVVAAAAFAVEQPFKNQNLYSLRFTITPGEKDVLFDVSIVDNATGLTVRNPRVTAQWGQWAQVKTPHANHAIELRMRMEPNRPAELFFTVKDGTELVQRGLYTWTATPEAKAESEFSGEPVTINVKDAPVRDIMATFADITGLTIEVAPDVTGTVSLYEQNRPWDELLYKSAAQVGAKVLVDGKTIRITK